MDLALALDKKKGIMEISTAEDGRYVVWAGTSS